MPARPATYGAACECAIDAGPIRSKSSEKNGSRGKGRGAGRGGSKGGRGSSGQSGKSRRTMKSMRSGKCDCPLPAAKGAVGKSAK